MKRTGKSTPTIPLLLIGMTAILSILMLLYIHIISKNTSQKFVPWIDASMEIKLETALAHLWFEEILSGDSDNDIEKVYQHLAQAKWYATAILDGGENEQGIYHPLKESELRAKVNRLLFLVQSFHQATDIRYTLPDQITQTDKQYDTLFFDIINESSALETALKQHISHENRSQNTLLLMLFIAICSMTFISAYSIWRFTHNRALYLRQLSSANLQISQQNSQLKTLAHTDQLTNLPNRKMLETTAVQSLSRVKRHDKWVSITFIDLDFFKPINDQYGHNIGDKVLVNFSAAIKMQLREGDMLSRIAGDEFILLIEANSESDLHESLDRIMSRVQDRLAQPIISSPTEIHIRCSAGTAIAPKDSIDFEVLVHFADQAMYESKKNGRGQHCYFKDINNYQNQLAFDITPEVEAATE